ncbi:non-ribosomal peptide synthetase [Clostridium niameyense]|uniref:non-ribosomal peptide synthetase n=1 Tax=Clostridium niameyense TaxID=1622073 RepID=UPI00067F5333|nr:non-ribosomal peptide synthetase [Clostridium niameyense]
MSDKINYLDFKKIIIDILQNSINEDIEQSNLVELGLNSLKTMLIINELRKRQIKVSFSQLMSAPYVKDWWKIIKEQFKNSTFEEINLMKKPYCREYPLTDVQYAYWLGRDNNQILGGVSCHIYFEFKCGAIDKSRLNDAWNKVQNHHSVLKTKFLSQGRQIICENTYKNNITVYDLKKLSNEKKNEKLKDIREKISHRLMKVEEGQVADVILSSLNENESIIHFDVELLVADLRSIKIILKDLLAAYEGKALSTIPLEWDFSNFIYDKLQEDTIDFQNAQKYWKNQVKDLPGAPQLPYCGNPYKIKSHRFIRRNYILNKNRLDLLKKYACQNHVTPAMIFLTIYAEILKRFSTSEEFLINVPIFDRPPEFENVVADFTNTVLLPIKNVEQNNFIENVLQIKDEFLEVMQYSSYSGVRVIRDILKNNLGQEVIAPVVFSCDYENSIINEKFEKALGKLSYISSQTPQVLIDFQIIGVAEGLMLSWDVVEEAFNEDVIEVMFDCYIKSLNWVIDNSHKWNETLSIIDENFFINRYLNMNNLNQRKSKCIHEEIFKNANLTPEKIAVIESDTGKEISYKELIKKSKKLATVLIKNNIGKGDKIGIRLKRGSNQIIATLAVLAVGASYVPIGIKQPINRVENIVLKSKIKYVITDLDDITPIDTNIKILTIDSKSLEMEDEIQNIIISDPKDIAYIIFTSGTTGEPKGVEITHSGAWNTINEVNLKCDVKKEDKLLSISSMEFDLSVYDIFGVLARGGTIVLIGEGKERDSSIWVSLMDKYEITLWNSVPFLLDMLLSMAEEEKKIFPFLRKVMLSGDWIGLDLPERLNKIAPKADILAMGGATEASIWSNFFEVKLPIPDKWVSIPYGKPLFGQLYRVVDKYGRDCPDWVPGELWIGGKGVANGYVGDEVLTKQKFVNFKGIRWYKTGDTGRFWNDGTIEFLGRNDTQVKIKGHRIELGEIENSINKYKGVVNSVVCSIKDIEGKNKNLGAYIVMKDKYMESGISNKKEENIDKIKEFLRLYLPEYMIPLKYYIAESMPLSGNGKVDRKKIAKILSECQGISQSKSNFELPKGKLEKELASIWKEVLKIKKIFRNDNFFEIGGDSLTAVSLISRIKNMDMLHSDISIQILFIHPTISLLAEEIQRMNKESELEVEIVTI